MIGDLEKMMKQSDVWAVISEYETVTFCWDKEAALDRMTRKDKLYHIQITGWKQIGGDE